jgi:hypothetical protein
VNICRSAEEYCTARQTLKSKLKDNTNAERGRLLENPCGKIRQIRLHYLLEINFHFGKFTVFLPRHKNAYNFILIICTFFAPWQDFVLLKIANSS